MPSCPQPSKTALNAGIYCAGIAFFLLPFIGGNHLPLLYVSIDRFWINNLFLLSLLLSVLSLFLFARNPERGFGRFALFFLPFLAVSAISYTYSWNRFGTLTSSVPLVLSFSFAYINLSVKERGFFLKAIVAGTTLLALCAIFQHTFLFTGLLAVAGQGRDLQILTEQSGIAFGSYLHHNMLGGYLAFILPLCLYFVVRKRSLFYSAAAVIMTAAIVLTSSRIALAIALIGFMAGFIDSVRHKDWTSLCRISGIVILSALLAFALIHDWTGSQKNSPVGVGKTLSEKTRTAGTQLSTLNTRTTIWKNSLPAIGNHPFFGFGAGSFEYAYRRYFDGSTYTSVAHSAVIKILVETGFVGLGAFLLYIAGVLLGMRRVADRGFRFYLALSCLSGFLFSLVDFSFDTPSHLITFFLLTSTFFGGRSRSAGTEKVPAEKGGSQRMWGALALVPVLLAVFFFVSRSDLHRRAIELGIGSEDLGLVSEALDNYREAQRYIPFSDEGLMREVELVGRLLPLTAMGDQKTRLAEGLAANLEILRTFPDGNAERYISLARGYRALGDGGSAEPYYSRALQYYPSSAYYVVEKASFFVEQGRLGDAEALIESFRPYAEKYRSRHDPRGIIIYKLRDIEAHVAYARGNCKKALNIAAVNLTDAQKGEFVSGSIRAREFVPQKQLLTYLSGRVDYYRSLCSSGDK